MKRVRILAVLVVFLLGGAAAGSAATKFTCNSGGRVWNLTPGVSPIEITAMFANGNTDCDLMVDDTSGFIIALGVSMESRYESVKFGPLPGVPVRVTAIKASGPNSKTYLRASDSLRFLRGSLKQGLEEIGTAKELANRDPQYARLLEQMKAYQRLKRPAAARE